VGVFDLDAALGGAALLLLLLESLDVDASTAERRPYDAAADGLEEEELLER
jgi:hypothetical protein